MDAGLELVDVLLVVVDDLLVVVPLVVVVVVVVVPVPEPVPDEVQIVNVEANLRHLSDNSKYFDLWGGVPITVGRLRDDGGPINVKHIGRANGGQAIDIGGGRRSGNLDQSCLAGVRGQAILVVVLEGML